MTVLAQKADDIRRASRGVGVDPILGEAHNRPALSRDLLVPASVAFGVVPIGAVNLDGDPVRHDGEVHPESPDPVLGLEADTGVGEGDSHRTLDTRLVAFLTHDRARMLLGMLRVVADHSFGMGRVRLAAPRCRDGINSPTDGRNLVARLAAKVVLSHPQGGALPIVQRTHPFVFRRAMASVGALMPAVVARLVLITHDFDSAAARRAFGADPRYARSVVAGLGAVASGVPSARKEANGHGERRAADKARSGNEFGTLRVHAPSLLVRLGGATPGAAANSAPVFSRLIIPAGGAK